MHVRNCDRINAYMWRSIDYYGGVHWWDKYFDMIIPEWLKGHIRWF